MAEITEQHLHDLIAQGLSERAIAKQTGIPRSTLQPRIAKLQGTPEVHTSVPEEPPTPTDTQDDLAEIIAWWQERKRLAETPPDPGRETQRQTYHVEKRYIAAIKREADLEQTSITEIVNRVFTQYFEKR